MKIDRIHYQTFKGGSTTYFSSSIFFPESIRRDVFILYGFVRTADDFVDAVPQDAEGFLSFRQRYEESLSGKTTDDVIIDTFVDLMKRKNIDPAWTEAFLGSMALDLEKKSYTSLEEILEYIYGSAEVIGLFMARLMDLHPDSHPSAQLLGRAMQYINFIRDIEEDRNLGRRYLPSLEEAPLDSLDPEFTRIHPERFETFVRHHLGLYRQWQKEAERGFAFIPRRYLVPIKTASDMYNLTARIIEKRPLVVYEKKVKPTKLRIILRVLGNALSRGSE